MAGVGYKGGLGDGVFARPIPTSLDGFIVD